MKNIIAFILFFFPSFFLSAQTIGTILFETGTLPGYTFFSPFSGTKAYLVDNCGRLINTWDRGTRPGLSAYFLENGLMMRTYKVPVQGPFSSASNAGGLELVDWENNRVWGYELNTPTSLSHHDAVMMPNGNILMLVWDIISDDDLIALGRNPNEIAPEGYAWNERIIEIETVGTNEINIVWEWRIRDHYIQDFDDAQANFGVISEHPELFDINLADITSSNSHSRFDYNHFNAIDYNEALDQIFISVRNSDEIWILDHSTTTAEAATHSGGRYNKGGDILYRWGNPMSYQRGTIDDQQLFGQHGLIRIPGGLNDAGKLMVYNNGNGRPGTDYSQVFVWTPPQDLNGGYTVPDTEAFGPENPDWFYGNSGQFYSPFLSNAQRLPNGNTLINAGSPGQIFEINETGEKVWQYIIPLNGDNPIPQGNQGVNNGNFRAYKFPEDYAGFEGKELIPGAIIEIDDNPPNCPIVSSLSMPTSEIININYDYLNQNLTIDLEKQSTIHLQIFNAVGKRIIVKKETGQYFKYPMSFPGTGIYFVKVCDPQGRSMGSVKILGYGNW